MANWQRAGDRNAAKPSLLRPPQAVGEGEGIGSGAIPISEFNDWWDNN